jgi:Ca2+-binding EF-hand superfamily protein
MPYLALSNIIVVLNCRERFTSGVISLSEFEKYCLKYASTKTFTPTRPFIELVFKAINRTKSGEISFSEFLDFLHMVKKGKPEEKLKWVFQLYLGDKAKTETTNEITKEDIVETLTVSDLSL